MVTPDDLRSLAPELEDYSDAVLQNWIDLAGVMVTPGAWGANYDVALKNLAAHYAVTGSIRGSIESGGMVASEKVGDLQRTYFQRNQGDADDYASTAYGSFYAQLMRTLVRGPFIV